MAKYISRVKEWFRMDGHSKMFSSWKEFTEKTKWTKLLKHGKLYGRSTMSKMEKHKANKAARKESKKTALNEEPANRLCGQCCYSCCTHDCIDIHPIDKDRWCHKFNKSVWDLEDASKCEFYLD